MQEEIKCPQCGGNKFSDRGNNTYKCMYCGSTFSTKKLEEVKPHETTKQANPSSNVTVYVNGRWSRNGSRWLSDRYSYSYYSTNSNLLFHYSFH